MQGFATVNMAGNLTVNPELRWRFNGDPVVSFCVAVNRVIRTEFSKRDWVDYIDCVKVGPGAEDVAVSFTKGNPVELCGRLVQQRWEERGYKKSKMVVEVATIEIVQNFSEVKERTCE